MKEVLAFKTRTMDTLSLRKGMTIGVKQANFQRRNLGFHRNYLMIIIETYGRSRSTNNVLFRGPTNETWHEIYQFPWRENLDSDIGIIFVKVTQPTGKTFNTMSLVGVCLNKEA